MQPLEKCFEKVLSSRAITAEWQLFWMILYQYDLCRYKATWECHPYTGW